MSKALKKAGSTTMYAFIQASGMVDDHSAECFKSQTPTLKEDWG
jgi:3-methyladenine DNA glycosylase Tag